MGERVGAAAEITTQSQAATLIAAASALLFVKNTDI